MSQPMRIRDASDEALDEAARRLRAGELVGIPTETVYGLAAHAFDDAAVVSIFEAKGRPAFDPLIVHVTERDLASLAGIGVLDRHRLTPQLRAAAERLTALWPGPLTLVLPKGPRVPDAATSGLDTVAIRCPAHPVTRALIDRLGAPLVAPSANRFGRISPTSAADVASELGDRIPLTLDGGRCAFGIESTIVGIEADGTARLLRPGAMSVEAIEAALIAPLHPPAGDSARAPGMLASHYAPRKPLILWRRGAPVPAREGPMATLLFSRDGPRGEPALVLAPSGDDREAARNLFSMMRELDASDATWILAELPEGDGGLLPAIRDRLTRAAAER